MSATSPERSHGAFKARLLEAMAGAPQLAALTTRADDDPTVAIADAWSASLHVLSFYVERFREQGYIETAQDPTAVDALARMVGYTPAPAISAGTVLAFTVDTVPGTLPATRIPTGTRVQNQPRAGESPAVFETSSAIEARREWNELSPKRRELVLPQQSTTTLRIRETTIAGRPGDVIAILKPKQVGFDFALARIDALESKPLDPIPHQLVKLDGNWSAPVPAAPHEIAVFSRRAALFGYNAPVWTLLPAATQQAAIKEYGGDETVALTEWPGLVAIAVANTNKIDLDAVYPEAIRGRHVLLTKTGASELFRISDVTEVSRTQFGVSVKMTQLTLDRRPATFDSDVRNTSVLIQTESVTLAESPITALTPSVAQSDRIALAEPTELPPGRLVVVRGEGIRAQEGDNAPRTKYAEAAVVKKIEQVNGVPTLVFNAPLQYRYNPQTLVVLGNAVRATHGETKLPPATQAREPRDVTPEVLGSGDARKHYQAFALKQPGLTHVAAPNAVGYAPEIEVRVDGIARPRVERLYGQPEMSRGYALEPSPEGATLVRFSGRLRTAEGNVEAVYRVGGGSGGNLEPERLVVPLTMPMGLRTVTNPLPASGGVDREGTESARRNAPIRIITLDRIVSLGDYEAFARAYGGISKALATLVWVGRRQVVHLTVAGARGASVPKGSELYEHLERAIRSASAPGKAFKLLDYTPRPFWVTLAVRSDPAFRREDVEAAVRQAFAALLSPEAREFGAPLARSHLLALAQAVPGVVAARVAKLALSADPNALDAGEILGAAAATATAGAELLILADGGLTLTEMGR